MSRWSARDVLLGLAAPVGALAFAFAVSALVLAATGHSPLPVFDAVVDSAQKPRSIANSLNSATTFYLSAVAVAIGFKMKLFNIGVDGQYRLAAMLSAALAGAAFMEALPSVIRVALTIASAMIIGAMWAGLAALLKVTRGVHEVISTIMLNAIATAIVAYLLNTDRLAVQVAGSNNIGTPPITEGGRVPGFDLPGSTTQVFGLLFLAVAVGIGYWYVMNRTRLGFQITATGMSQTAATAGGISVKKMILFSMLLSGAVAGLVGMPQLLGASYWYALDFPAGLGFTGIAIALLGRNHAVGMAFAALLWAVLNQSSNILDLSGVPKEIVAIMQGIIVLSVVIAYELMRRYRLRLEQRDVGKQLGRTTAPNEDAEVAR